MVVGERSGEHDPDLFLVGQIALRDLAFLFEAPQRIELQPSCVDQSAVGRTAPVAAFAQRDGGFGREGEAFVAGQVVLNEDAEVAVGAEFAVDDAAVDELEQSRRGDLRAAALYLGLSESEAPGGRGPVVEDGVGDDVGVAAGVGGVARESQLDVVDQLGRVDVAVELDLQPLDARLDLAEGEIAVEGEPDEALHPQTHGQRETFARGAVGDAFADFDRERRSAAYGVGLRGCGRRPGAEQCAEQQQGAAGGT